MFIDREFIGAVIGPGGKVIQEMQERAGTTINIEEKNNMGEVSVFGTNKEGVERAEQWIKGIVAVPVVGDVYEATVKSIMPFGAFVEFLPGKQGLVHISEVSWKRLETLDGILKEGDKVKVKLIGTRSKIEGNLNCQERSYCQNQKDKIGPRTNLPDLKKINPDKSGFLIMVSRL